ncbi:MAG: response regulator [Gammaproteobacteria bacterium]|nr:response regulator [Gammaproteobacteria bacterium]
MNRTTRFKYKDFLIPIALSLLVIISSLYNFLLFHTVAELFSITVAIIMAVVAWNMYPFTRNNFLLYLGCGYFWVGILDLMHTLTFRGMNLIITDGANTGLEFWITTRYLEAALLLTSPLFLTRTINPQKVFTYFALIALIIFSAVINGWLPELFIEGQGLTDFKIYSEYVIIAILALAILTLNNHRELLDARVYHLMIASIVLTMLAEISFTLYLDVVELPAIVGHILKMFSYWVIFLAVIRTTLQEPFAMMAKEASTYDAIPDATIITDDSGVIRQANKKAAELSKIQVSELIGKNSADVFQIGKDDIVDGRLCEKEVRIGGEDKWLSYSYTPIAKGHVTSGQVEVIRDITDRKQAEIKYEQVNSLKNSIIENLPMMLFVKDAEYLRYVEWNKSAEQVTGLVRENMLGKDDYDLWTNEEAEFFIQKDREVLGEHKLLEIPVETLSTVNGIKELHTRKIPIYDDEGTPQYLLGLAEDISEKLQTEKALRESQKMDALGKLTGGIAHDFNNMLSVILGFSEIMKDRPIDGEKAQAYSQEIFKAGQRGMKLTKKLLAFTRSKESDAKIVDLNSILLDEQHMLEKTLTVRIELKYDLVKDIWPVKLDSTDFEDSVLNIAINAMHAMSGSGSFFIATSNEYVSHVLAKELNILPGAYVMLTLSDTGIGMDEVTLSHISDPFFSTKGELGTGLGLSQVYGFVQRSNGGIKVISNPGEGTTFRLYFPRSTETRTNQDAADSFSIEGIVGDEHILIVDDEPAIRLLMTKILKRAGYQVSSATDGEDALEKLSSEEFDLMITDIIMPRMDGFQLTQQAMKLYPEMKVQLISGYSDNIDRSNIEDSVYEEMLQKPFGKEELLLRVRELMDSDQVK